MGKRPAKFEKAATFILRDILSPISPRLCTRFMTSFYRRHGMRILGAPNYLSARIWFDGTDYSLIELGEGCTISSFVRVLTHDWSIHTLARGMGLTTGRPVGIFRPVRVGRFSFVGTCSVLLPGAELGEGVLVGAGSVVRGKVPDWTIVGGSPAVHLGDSRQFVERQLRKQGLPAGCGPAEDEETAGDA